MSVFDVMGEEDFDGVETMESLVVEAWERAEEIDDEPQYGTREYAEERGRRW